MTRKSAGIPKEVPGNVMQSALQQERWLIGLGLGWVRLLDAFQRAGAHDIEIDGMSIRCDMADPGEVLVVLRGVGEAGRIVAFHNTADLYGLWKGLAARMDNGSLKWREDEYGR